MWYWGNVSSKASKLCQLNLMENAQEALAFRKDFFGKPSKRVFHGVNSFLNSAGPWNFIKI